MGSSQDVYDSYLGCHNKLPFRLANRVGVGVRLLRDYFIIAVSSAIVVNGGLPRGYFFIQVAFLLPMTMGYIKVD